MSSQRQKFH